jgi:hypothetical protein
VSSAPTELTLVELRVSVSSTAAATCNPHIDAGSVARVLSASWSRGIFMLCLLVEESPKPEQVGLIAVVPASMTRIPRGETTT